MARLLRGNAKLILIRLDYHHNYGRAALRGMSGGPVLDSHDTLVGIHGRATIDLSTGVNFVTGYRYRAISPR
jgi:hypothetical protein